MNDVSDDGVRGEGVFLVMKRVCPPNMANSSTHASVDEVEGILSVTEFRPMADSPLRYREYALTALSRKDINTDYEDLVNVGYERIGHPYMCALCPFGVL